MEIQKPDRLLYRIKTVAEKLDISVSQAYNLINRGDLDSVRIGKSLRVPASELERIAAAGSTSA